MTELAVLPYGPRGVLIEAPDATTRRALTAWLARTVPPEVDVVPAGRTVLLQVDDLQIPPDAARGSLAAVVARVRALDPAELARGEVGEPVEHEIAAAYDGPDLDEAAAALDLSPAALVDWHCNKPWTVEFIGFMPGFGYLTRADHRQPVDRRASPRSVVPTGSVALAGTYCGVYPAASPGGWQLIGRTAVPMFDPTAGGSRLAAGDLVTFRPVR